MALWFNNNGVTQKEKYTLIPTATVPPSNFADIVIVGTITDTRTSGPK